MSKVVAIKMWTLEKRKVLSEHFLMDDNIWHTEDKQQAATYNQQTIRVIICLRRTKCNLSTMSRQG